jgi:CBS domain-containing protein
LKVKDVMAKRVITAWGDASILEVFKALYSKHVGSIVIVDDEKKCIGIFTERDAIRSVAKEIPLDSPIGSVMTRNVFTIKEDASLSTAGRRMRDNNIRRLPVVDDEGRITGIVTMRGILNELLEISRSRI